MNGHSPNIAVPERFYYMDVLRVIAILLMFVFHVSMIFVAEHDWHIKNAEQSRVLLEFNEWMAFFRMPLLFLVSGFVSYGLLSSTNARNFIRQRFNRLIIPTVIGTFILVAPQLYFERRLEGYDFSYIEFYKTFLQFSWYPEGSFHWLHLWFIPYLFAYNLLSIPLHRFLNSKNLLIGRLESFCLKPRAIFIFIMIAILPNTFLSVHYPATYDFVHDYARHSLFLFFIIAGLLCFRFGSLMDMIEANRQLFCRLALLTIVIINTLRWNDWEPYQIWANWIEKPQTYLYIAFLNVNTWMWVLAFVGYAKKYLNKSSDFLRYANKAVYPFYILHQTFIVVIGYYVIQTADAIVLKYGFILLVCFLLSILTWHLFIRPYSVMRFLFGTK